MSQHWLTRPETIAMLWQRFLIVLVITVVAGLFVDMHPHFGIDAIFGFYAWFGFLTCVVMVIGAKLLGFAIKRPDNYYEDDHGDA